MMNDRKFWAVHLRTLTSAAIVCITAKGAIADPRCAAFEAGETLPIDTYLDRPDPVISRVTAPIEEALLAEQIAGAAPAPLSKHYCRIGMFEMTIRFNQPLRDDSLAALTTEAIYEWRTDGDPPGWQLSALRRQPLCARGDAPFTPVCP